MKQTFILTYLVLIVLFTISCQRENSNILFENFKQLIISKDNDSLYIIPGSGCTGCITEIEKFAIENYHKPNIFFVFTKIKSYKLLKNRFGKDFINSKNVILDSMNIFIYPTSYNDIYPLLLQKVNGEFLVKKSLKP